MSNASAQPDPLERACALVGRFLYHFGRVEQKIDQAVIKLLDLDEKAAPIVTGSVDFAKKLNCVRTSAYTQAGNATNQQFGEDSCVGVFEINNARQVIAHSSFEAAPGGGVQFRRTVSKDGRVRVDDPLWTETKFSEHYAKMNALEADLNTLILLIKPLPPFGWSAPPWQETYHRSSSAAALAATSEMTQWPPNQKL